MEIGKTIKTLRELKREGYEPMKQKELAKKAGISANHLSQIENGGTEPSKETISKLCIALNVPNSIVAIMSLTIDDVPEEKKEAFRKIYDPLMGVINEFLGVSFL